MKKYSLLACCLLYCLFVQVSQGYAWIKILQGDRITVGMNNYVAVACSSNEIGGFYDFYDWNQQWGGGTWLTGLGDNYAVFLFDPNFTATGPTPFATGTLVFYTGYYGTRDSIKITAWPDGNYKNGPACGEGDPVNPSFGNMFGTEDLFSKPGRGGKLNLNFAFHNASREIENPDIDGGTKWQRPMGFGRTHNYNIYLTIDGGGSYNNNWSVRLHDGNGNTSYFNWNTTYSIYSSEKGNHSYLEKSGSNPNFRWTLKRNDGTICYFSQNTSLSARLDSLADNNGNKQRLTYTGTTLTKIADDLNREINIRYYAGTPYIQYVYTPPDTITGYRYNFNYTLNGAQYDLVTVSYKDSLRADSSTLLHRYYYDANHLIKVRALPTGKNTQNNDTTGSSRKWDRVTYWYDSDRRPTYEEAVNGDGDTVLSNDIVIYKAHFKYFMGASGYPESTVVYYQIGQSTTGARNPFTDTVPSLPASDYYRKSFRYNTNGYSNTQVTITPTGDSSCITYGTYDADYNPSSITDPNGSQTLFYYYTYRDSVQALRYAPLPDTTIYPNSDTVFTYYSAKAGNKAYILPDSGLDEAHNKALYLYDSAGNDTAMVYKSRVLADGDTNHHDVTTRYHYYAPGGNLKEILDPLGHKTKMYYAPDSAGPYLLQQRTVMSTDTGSSDIVTKYGFNTKKCTLDTLTFYRDYPNNPSIVTNRHNIYGSAVKTVQPDTSYDSVLYDKRMNILEKYVRKSDTTLSKTIYTYDARDHLTKIKEYRSPNDSANAYDSTLYANNLHDKMISQTNALGQTTNYTYCMDRLVKIAYPDTTNDSLGYWDNGALKFKKDRLGAVTGFEYDGYSGGCLCASRYRLTKKKYYTTWYNYSINYSNDSVAYEYDAVGNRTKMVDKNGTTVYSYDDLYRLKTDSCGYLNTKLMYLYDQAGNRTRLKVCNGDTSTVYLDQTYKYDNANRADTVTVAGDNYAFTYWDTGVPKRVGYPNLVAEEYWLKPRGFVDSLVTAYWDDPTIRSVRCRNRYTYNGLGDRLSHYISLNRPGTTALTGTVNYTYDGLRRLKQVKNPTGFNGGDTITYTYDKMGNRTYKDNKKISDITYAYNQANNQLTSRTGSMNYSYDDNGNMIQWANGDYYITNYGYDCENRLTKVTWDASADSTLFFYNGDGVRLKKVGTKDSSTQYLVDGMNSVVERTSTGRMRYKYIYVNGMMLSRIDSSGTKLWYGHDALGSINGITDTYGDAVKSYLYDEFGDSIGEWGATVKNNYKYTGQEWDAAPAYAYNLRAREYYPKVGRFMQNDPIGNAGGSLNWYLYVANNPINWIDPEGLYVLKDNIPAPDPKLLPLLKCIDQCFGNYIITSTTDSHASNTPHGRGEAFDIRYPNNSSKFLCCAAKCGAGYGLDEKVNPSSRSTGPHIHIQLGSGTGGGIGNLPKDPCDCK